MGLIASNIANAGTPGFKAKDIDFAAALKASAAGTDTGKAMDAATLYRVPVMPSLDGNTVEMDVERQKMAENSLMHQFSLDRVSGHFKHFMELLQNLK